MAKAGVPVRMELVTMPPPRKTPSKLPSHRGGPGPAALLEASDEALLRTGALQNAIFNSANFSSIATDANAVIQIYNVGAQRMLG
jgi:hypothetical protein